MLQVFETDSKTRNAKIALKIVRTPMLHGCLENEDRRPKTKDLETEDPLENEDLEKEDPLENEDLEKEDPLENEDLENEDPLENEDLEKEDPLENEDLENEDPLENEDLENEDPLENEDLENEDPLENEDLENEDPLEKHENTKQKIEAESSVAYPQISEMAETWPGVLLASWSLQVPVLFSDKRAKISRNIIVHVICFHRKTTRQQQKKETSHVENTSVTRTNDTATGSFFLWQFTRQFSQWYYISYWWLSCCSPSAIEWALFITGL